MSAYRAKNPPLVLLSWLLAGSLTIGTSALPTPLAAADQNVSSVLVQFAPTTTPTERLAAIADMGGSLVSWLPQITTAEVQVPTCVLATGLQHSEAIQHVELNAPVKGDDLVVDDPALSVPDQSYAQRLVGAPAAWAVESGRSAVIVAVVDSGINPDHPEFAHRLVPGHDFANNDADPRDDNGHGTHVAGIIGAALNNGQGAAGICPNCSLMPVKVLNAQNSSNWGTVARGILYAVDHGAQVINLSLGASVSSFTLEHAILYAQEHEVLVVASAGNGGGTLPHFPAALPGVIAVSAINPADELSFLSNTGEHIVAAAPGEWIYSTYYDLDMEGGYAYMSGTSMAAGFVSGLAGLLFSQDDRRSAAQVFKLITATALDLGQPGHDSAYGYGRIDVARSVTVATLPTTVTDPTIVSSGKGMDGPSSSTMLGEAVTVYLPLLVCP